MLITELAKLCQAQVQGGNAEQEVSSAADIMSALAHQVTVLSDSKYKKYLKDTQATACFISVKLADEQIPDGLTLLICDDPEISFLDAVKLLHPEPAYTRQVSTQAVLAEQVELGEDVHIGPFVSIGAVTRIGAGATIDAGVRIGNHVSIGKYSRIHANAVIYDHCVIGDHVIIHAGAIIGADGFGYKFRNNQHIKVPHVGNVEIADFVEIGANTCIDRGALGATRIGAGSKIDNLVQLGHNNIVGRNVIICGQSGISGSCTIGDGAILAGSAGVADHVNIGSRAVIMARSGISADVEPGAQVFGSPAKDRKLAWRELAALSKLPELLQKFKNLETRVSDLEQ
ncbi:UDP-3-O-(3-hydroxymyristoyl)glucosamine N-acyltransferase [Methylomonas paludis]|uniref:UDP-3-O-acylglucosamine N-acyltransferase n=1 Tax=Methylomonas paludis TaxID=1173101 RepID=A0A975ML27_9GAMM|nr:UDP-3-O-(3-hydroxymyristoyl)glucosamine N-acyltransferase [Methylomonas paludis]QWF69787.1 UDP-3-O-(3-hydroxymyristoyl)glucosamine N-acyltransferase [Methylomonas paludis]